MSRVYFHSPSGEAELWGGERAWLSGVAGDMAIGLLDVQSNGDRLGDLIDASGRNSYLRKPADPGDYLRWRCSLETALRVSMGDVFAWNGQPIDSFSLLLNTAAAAGSAPMMLAARIHGQCEIHCYCEAVDRPWLAGLITQGLESGVFRQDIRKFAGGHADGWEEVRAFLLNRDDEPVVLSYSVTESFPSRYTSGWEAPPCPAGWTPSWASEPWGDEYDGERETYWQDEAWDALGTPGQWEAAMSALRQSGGGLRLDPANWSGFRFGHKLSALDLLAPDYRERLDAAFPAPVLAG